VKLRKVVKQLRREFVADPKKGVVLGLLGVVALWFWAPMVSGWLAPKESTADVAAVVATTESGEAVATGKTAESQHNWEELVEWIENDPQMSPAELRRRETFANIWRWWPLSDPASQPRDPFQIPQSLTAQTQPENEAEAESEQENEAAIAVGDVTPQGLGLLLSGTLVGRDRAVARIGGKTYRAGNTVAVTKDGQQIVFELVEVHPRRIVLQRDGEQYELSIAGPGDSGQIELVKRAN